MSVLYLQTDVQECTWIKSHLLVFRKIADVTMTQERFNDIMFCQTAKVCHL